MNKRIIKSLCIAAVAALAIGGTYSYFSDTETSVGNKFVAGKLNLKIDNTCHYNGKVCSKAGEVYLWENSDEPCYCSWEVKDLNGELFFNLEDIKPGDFGEDTISLHVDNNDAWLCAEVANLKNNDNDCENPEFKDEALAYGAGSETCGDPGSGEGELQYKLLFTIWKDNGAGANACNNILDTDETASVTDQPAKAGIWPIADASTGSGPIAGGSTICYGVKWNVPLTTNNIIQTDSLEGDLKISAIQARHMEDFLCSDIAPSICGNFIVEPGEQCDDGNTAPGDGCDANCQIESGSCTTNSDCLSTEFCDLDDGCNGSGTCETKPVVCPLYYSPVCGCDNTTYGNLCLANESGLNAAYGGVCESCTPSEETCNSLDDDCDGQVDEGTGGAACDGPDSDLCAEGVYTCTSGALVCSDNTGSTLDVCDGNDNDCDPASVDGSEDPQNGASCNTGLQGICSGGIKSCSGGSLECVALNIAQPEICNGLDDDCDGVTDEGC